MQIGRKRLDAIVTASRLYRNRECPIMADMPCMVRLDRLQLLEDLPALEQFHRFLQLDILLQ
jgi:hypothetical protein